jgi:hypothetical protein
MIALIVALLAVLLLPGCPAMWYDPGADPTPDDALPSWVDPETPLEDQCFDARSELEGFSQQQWDGTPFNDADRAERVLTERFVAAHCDDDPISSPQSRLDPRRQVAAPVGVSRDSATARVEEGAGDGHAADKCHAAAAMATVAAAEVSTERAHGTQA